MTGGAENQRKQSCFVFQSRSFEGYFPSKSYQKVCPDQTPVPQQIHANFLSL